MPQDCPYWAAIIARTGGLESRLRREDRGPCDTSVMEYFEVELFCACGFAVVVVVEEEVGEDVETTCSLVEDEEVELDELLNTNLMSHKGSHKSGGMAANASKQVCHVNFSMRMGERKFEMRAPR